ncbi:MAG TPA: hypothetical protein PLP17_06745, partial [Oligoflexia bacterium]|nr:hypothetical protein [Oligoflexia bacterium]
MKLVSVVVSMACFSLSLVLFSSRAYAARFEYDLQPGVSDCFGTYEGCMHINVFRLNDVRTEGHLDLAVLSGMLVIDDELRTASLDVSLRVEDNLVIHYGKTPAEDYRPFKDDELVHLTFSSNPGGNFSGDPWNAGFKVLEPTNGTGVLA